jgi:hypothetical protein
MKGVECSELGPAVCYCPNSSNAVPLSMTIRTSSKAVTFRRSFRIDGVDRLLPAADYQVVTEDELIESLSFLSYRPVSTAIVLHGEAGSMVEMVIIDPLDLQAAQGDDAAMCAREMACDKL